MIQRQLSGGPPICVFLPVPAPITEIKEFVTGEIAAPSVGRALLTLVFLDIVASTDQLAAMGDERWRSVLEQLDVSVKRQVAGFGGPRIKHTGMAIFCRLPARRALSNAHRR